MTGAILLMKSAIYFCNSCQGFPVWGTGGVYTILGTNESVNGALLKFYNVHICCLALTVDFLTTQWSFTFAPYIYPNCVKAGTGILGEDVVSSRKSPSGPGEVLPNRAVTSDPWVCPLVCGRSCQGRFAGNVHHCLPL